MSIVAKQSPTTATAEHLSSVLLYILNTHY